MPSDNFNEAFLSSLMKQFEKMESEGCTDDDLLKKYNELNISKLYREILEETADSTIQDFMAYTQEAISKDKVAYNSFMNIQYKTWGNSLDVSEMMYGICVEAMDEYCSYYYDLERENPDSIAELKYTFISCREICARACQQYLEIYTLAKDGLADGAFARWRSLYELSIVIQFIRKQGEDVAKAFFESAFDFEGKNYAWAKAAPCFSHYSDKSEVSFAALQKKCNIVSDVQGKYYKSACKAVHANATATFGRIGIHPGVTSNGIGRSIYGINEPIVHAAVSMSIIISRFLDIFSSGDNLLMIRTINKWPWLIKETFSNAEKSLNQKIENNS